MARFGSGCASLISTTEIRHRTSAAPATAPARWRRSKDKCAACRDAPLPRSAPRAAPLLVDRRPAGWAADPRARCKVAPDRGSARPAASRSRREPMTSATSALGGSASISRLARFLARANRVSLRRLLPRSGPPHSVTDSASTGCHRAPAPRSAAGWRWRADRTWSRCTACQDERRGDADQHAQKQQQHVPHLRALRHPPMTGIQQRAASAAVAPWPPAAHQVNDHRQDPRNTSAA